MKKARTPGLIATKFASLKAQNRKALITYVTAGDPDLKTTEKIVIALEKAGADIVELGIPYSDPLADGPVIQRASVRAIKAGTKLSSIFDLVKTLRQKTQIPLVFLIYYNQMLQYGLVEFVNQCEQVGVDGIIIPDLPLEERQELNSIITKTDAQIDLIPLVAPTSSKRVAAIVQQASGFVYCISSTGVTGRRNHFDAALSSFVGNVKTATNLPTAIGFGISNTAGINQLKDYADGLIIGSAIVRQIEEAINRGHKDSISQAVYDFVKPLRQALD